jgi:ribosomal subunit interface protein
MKLRDAERTILVQSSSIDLGDVLPEYARSSILQVANKYIGTLNFASVHFSREGSLYRCTVNVQMSALRVMSGEAANKNAYTAFRNALAKVAKQLRRTKRELREDKAQRIDKGIFIHQVNRVGRQADRRLRGDAAELDRLIAAGSEQAPWKFRRESARPIAAE